MTLTADHYAHINHFAALEGMYEAKFDVLPDKTLKVWVADHTSI